MGFFAIGGQKTEKLTYSALAQIVGTSKQNVSRWFEVEDDLKLSHAQQICQTLGYNLTFSILHSGNTEKRSPESSAMPQTLISASADPSLRLHKLATFLLQREYSVLTFSQRTGIDRGHIYRHFTNDDIFISILLTIVEALGSSFTWKLNKTSGPGRSVITVPTIKKKQNNNKPTIISSWGNIAKCSTIF